MNYPEISKETISYLYKSYNSLKKSPLDTTLRILLELRTSQINGCEYCCKLHTEEAKNNNIPDEKLNSLHIWSTSDLFSEKEKIALKWCELLTNVNKAGIFESKLKLKDYFSEREIVDLTATISLMNALNRISISLR